MNDPYMNKNGAVCITAITIRHLHVQLTYSQRHGKQRPSHKTLLVGYVKQTKWEYSGTKKQLYVHLGTQREDRNLKMCMSKISKQWGKKGCFSYYKHTWPLF